MDEPLMEQPKQQKQQYTETGIKKYIGMVARWSFFIFSFIAILMSFGHLHIKFKDVKCKKYYGDNNKVRCTRNLAWLKYNNGLKFDSNADDWRSVISFSPDVFFDVWTPFVFAIFSFFQCFKGYRLNLLMGTWFKSFLYIIVWHLFAIIGYAANWGVLVGLWGILLLGLLYFVMTVICLFDGVNEDHHETTLQLDVEAIIMMALGKVGINLGSSSSSQANQGSYQQPTAPGNDQINNPNPNQNNIGNNQAPPTYQSQGYQSSGLDNNYQQQTEYQAFQPPEPVDQPPQYQQEQQE